MPEVVAEPKFPWFAMSSICLGMLAHSVVFTSPLPYVAFMVVDFDMADHVDTAGYSAGWITGAFMIGRFIAGIPWGILSDKWGRRPCLILSMANVAIFGLAFGFSTNFTMAVVLRFMIGLGNGFMCVAKTCVSEIVETKEHEMRAFGYLNSIWGLGLIVGPALGGMLSRVAIQYPGAFREDSIWGQFPYLLPCVVCALMAVVAGVWIALCLPETLGNNKTLRVGSNSSTTTTDEESGVEMTEGVSTTGSRPKLGWGLLKSGIARGIGGTNNDKHSAVKFSSLSSVDETDDTDIEQGRLGGGAGGSSTFAVGSVSSSDSSGSESEGEDCHNRSVKNKIVSAAAVTNNGDDDKFVSSSPQSTTVTLDEQQQQQQQQQSKDRSEPRIVLNKTKNGYALVSTSQQLSGGGEDDNHGDAVFEGTDNILLSTAKHDDGSSDTSTSTSTSTVDNDSNSNPAPKTKKPSTYQEIVSAPAIQTMIGIYMAFCFAIMFVDESFPLWAVTSIERGGLAWDSAQVGGVLATVGAGLVVYQFFLYEPVMRRFFTRGATDTYYRLVSISSVCISLVPFAAGLSFYAMHTESMEESRKNVACYLSVIACLMIYRTSAGSAFTTLGIEVNNSVDQSMRGTMNGIIMTAGSMGNAAGPIIGSICYAFALTLPQALGPIPLDGRIVFVVGGVILVVLAHYARRNLISNA